MAKAKSKPMQVGDGVQEPAETLAQGVAVATAEPTPEAESLPLEPTAWRVSVQHAPTLHVHRLPDVDGQPTFHVREPGGKASGDVQADSPFAAYKAFLGMRSSQYQPQIVALPGV